MVRDEDVRTGRTHAVRPLDQEPRVAEAESADERHLERAGDVLLRAPAEQPGDPLRNVEDEKDRRKDGKEDQRAQPRQGGTSLPGNMRRAAGGRTGALFGV